MFLAYVIFLRCLGGGWVGRYTLACVSLLLEKDNPWVEENSGYIINQPLAPNGTNKGLMRPSLRFCLLSPRKFWRVPILTRYVSSNWVGSTTNYYRQKEHHNKLPTRDAARGVCLSCQYFTLYHLHLPGLHSRRLVGGLFSSMAVDGGTFPKCFCSRKIFSTENGCPVIGVWSERHPISMG